MMAGQHWEVGRRQRQRDGGGPEAALRTRRLEPHRGRVLVMRKVSPVLPVRPGAGCLLKDEPSLAFLGQ